MMTTVALPGLEKIMRPKEPIAARYKRAYAEIALKKRLDHIQVFLDASDEDLAAFLDEATPALRAEYADLIEQTALQAYAHSVNEREKLTTLAELFREV